MADLPARITHITPARIFEQGRRPPIQGLTSDGHGWEIWVGQDGVTRIELVHAPGQMAMVPWFNVYQGDRLHMSINAAQVGTVAYQRTEEDPTP